MPVSSKYKPKENIVEKTKKYTLLIDEATANTLDLYFEFLYTDCGLDKKEFTRDRVLSDIVSIGLEKIEKSKEWETKILSNVHSDNLHKKLYKKTAKNIK